MKKDEFLALIKNEKLREIAETLIKNGFTLITETYSIKDLGKKGLTYLTYSKNNKFGYVEMEWPFYETFKLSSEYVPSREHGTGSQYKTELYNIPEISEFEKSMESVIIRPGEKTRPKFYESLEHYKKVNSETIIIK